MAEGNLRVYKPVPNLAPPATRITGYPRSLEAIVRSGLIRLNALRFSEARNPPGIFTDTQTLGLRERNQIVHNPDN